MNKELEVPKEGEVWQHYKGGQYIIVCIALREEDKESLVVYKSINGNLTWVRPLVEFIGAVKSEEGCILDFRGSQEIRFVPGKFVSRFFKVE